MSLSVNIGPDDWPSVLSFNLRQAGALSGAWYGGWESCYRGGTWLASSSHCHDEPQPPPFSNGEPATIGTRRTCKLCKAEWYGGSRSRCPFCALHGRPVLGLVP